jgi:molybdopterin-guanine dinucleotide biosynthesis protein A
MVTIVVQAGGQSSRMGQDKALMPFLDRPLIMRQVQRLQGLADELLVTTNKPEAYAFLGLPLFGDLIPGAGALGGLYTALHAASHDLVAVIACDMPFVSADLIRAQFDLLVREEVDVVMPRSQEGMEPLHAVYRKNTCLPAVRAALDAGERKMIAWLPAVRLRVMPAEEVAVFDPEFRSFVNVNSPEEFRQAEDLARQQAKR